MTFSVDKSRWVKVKFGSVIHSVTNRIDNPSESGVERYVGLEHLDPGSMTVSRWGTPDQVEATKLLFEKGDVIFGRRRAYQKKVSMAAFRGICSAHALVLRGKPGLINPLFLPVFLSSDYFLNCAIKISVGSLSPTVNWKTLEVQEFVLPPVEEQEKIADLCWKIEEHIEALQLHLKNSEVLENQLLRSILNLDGSEYAIADLLVSSLGGTWGSNPGKAEVEVSVIRGTDIFLNGDIDVEAAPKRSVKKTELDKKRLVMGDIIVEKSGGSPDQPVGKVGYFSGLTLNVAASNFCVVLRADNKKVEPYFLFLVLRSLYLNGYLAAYVGKTTNLANLRIPEMLKKKIQIPSFEIQENEIRKHQEVSMLNRKILEDIRSVKMLRSSVLQAIFKESLRK